MSGIYPMFFSPSFPIISHGSPGMFNGFFDFFVSAILAMLTAATQILLAVALYAGWLQPEARGRKMDATSTRIVREE